MMTDAEMRIAIAEACGWRNAPSGVTGESRWFPPPGDCEALVACYIGALPDFPNDLNAMHGVEQSLSADDFREFHRYLWLATRPFPHPRPLTFEEDVKHTRIYTSATARQRAEAFLKTIGKWKD